MKLNYKKSLKFVTLLISALLIATVSATIYDYMYLNANVGVQGMYLAWKLGADNSTAGTQINGVTATLTNLKGPPNGTRIYADPVRLNNTGGSTITFDLLIDTVSGNTVYLDSIIVRIYNVTNGASIRNATVWTNATGKGSDETGLQIGSNHVWRFQWEIKWKSTALGTHTATVYLKIKVPV
jgi:hypothetical protein